MGCIKVFKVPRCFFEEFAAGSPQHGFGRTARKRIEQAFGWVKTIGDLRKLPVVGLATVRAWATWNFAAYNLIRIGGIGGWWNPSPT
ncbi:MAG TPA: hypothetical protein VMR06_18140 [Dokdonella sp.]|uniref:hypothetical protein n=1 Tax=Dokdonella sp. TaxID=2291710 RepID=UPI002C8DC05C|nr:hypothetical protein [Dokdonella sp.]HUD43909.1 hypothetical protein [Dokdonella sp.]